MLCRWSVPTIRARYHASRRTPKVAMLPAEVPLELLPNEGDPRRKATRGALDALDSFFKRTGRKIHLSSGIAVFYPESAASRPTSAPCSTSSRMWTGCTRGGEALLLRVRRERAWPPTP